MILRGIVKIIKTVVDGLAAVIAWLLVALGLWIPAVYVLAYVIICAVTHVSVTGNMAVFWTGLIMSAVLSVTFACARIRRRKKPEDGRAVAESNLPKLKKREPRVTMDNGQDSEEAPSFDDDLIGAPRRGRRGETTDEREEERNARPKRKEKDYYSEKRTAAVEQRMTEPGENRMTPAGEERMTAAAREPKSSVHNERRRAETTMARDENRDLEEKYFGADERRLPRGGEEPAQRADLPRFYANGSGRYERTRDEQPLVFRLRGDPTVFVCEYSDRLEYYKRTRSGMELMKKEYKNSRMID